MIIRLTERLITAFRFLTIIPLPSAAGETAEREVGRSSAFFPVVGLFQGLLLALFHLLFMKLFPLDITAALLVVLLVITSGGFHLDGLSDTFDALASRRGRDGMLEVMKDSNAGPIGVVAVTLTLLLKYLLLREVLALPGIPLHLPLVLFPVAGRWIMVPAMYHGRSARPDGLGRIFMDNTGAGELAGSLIILSAVVAGLAICGGVTHAAYTLRLTLLPLGPVYAVGLLAAACCNGRFGGLTGDTLGAISEAGEVVFLLSYLVTAGW